MRRDVTESDPAMKIKTSFADTTFIPHVLVNPTRHEPARPLQIRSRPGYLLNRTRSGPVTEAGPAWSRNRGRLLGLLFVLLATAAFSARASDPVGIYAFVDKVIFEPNEQTPDRVQVWGGFALAKGKGEEYEAAQRGYMYFKLRTGEEDICRKEWADLKAVAGTGQIVAFGSRHDSKGTVRSTEAKPERPDAHPKGWGLTKVKVRKYPPLDQLVALQAKHPGAKP